MIRGGDESQRASKPTHAMIEPRLAGIYQRFNWHFPVLAARQRRCLKRVKRVGLTMRQSLPVLPGGLNRSMQHFILKERWSVI